MNENILFETIFFEYYRISQLGSKDLTDLFVFFVFCGGVRNKRFTVTHALFP